MPTKHMTQTELIDGVTVTSVGVEYSRKLSDGDYGHVLRGGTLWVQVDDTDTPDESEVNVNDIFANLGEIVTNNVREQMIGFLFAKTKTAENRLAKLWAYPDFAEAAGTFVDDWEADLEAKAASELQAKLVGEMPKEDESA